MALPQRTPTPAIDPAPAATPSPPLAPVTPAAVSPWGERRDGFRPGGEVGRMHAELAMRLAGAATRPRSPQERAIRFLSVAGGYAALAAGYAVVALLLLR